MIFIILSLVLLIICIEALSQYDDILKKIGPYCVVIVLCIISGLRYDVGKDYMTYKGLYEETATSGFFQLEPFWLLVNPILNTLGFASRAWFILTSIFINVLYFIGIKRMSKDVLLSLLLYVIISTCYVESFNVVRQFVAGAILFASYNYIIENKPWKYYLCIAFAMLFHYSALIMLPFAILSKKRFPIVLMWIIFIGAYIVGNVLIPFVLNSVLPVFSRYAVYADADVESYSGGLKFMYFIIGCGILATSKYILKRDENNYYYINMSIMGLTWYFVFLDIQVLYRCMFYLTPFLIILIPNILYACKPKTRVLLEPIIVLMFLSVTLKMNIGIPYTWDLILFNK